jgi:uncharacterized protein
MLTGLKAVMTVLLLWTAVHPVAAIAGPMEDGDAAYHRKDYAAAMRHWKPLAAAHNAAALVDLAILYYSGLGVVRDYHLAYVYLSEASDLGDPQADYLLAALYRDGTGVERDQAKALALFRKAAEQDVPGAEFDLGLMHFLGNGAPADYREAFYWFSLASSAAGKEHAQLRATADYMRHQAEARLSKEEAAELRERIKTRQTAQSR